MKWNNRRTKALLGVLLSAAMLVPILTAAIPGTAAHAGETSIKYRNSIFTKKLYQNTVKIGYGTDKNMTAEDSRTIKKVYRLLAGMELKEKKEGFNKTASDAFSLVIYKKGGGRKTCWFSGGFLKTGGTIYKIVKNNPSAKIPALWNSKGQNNVAKAVYPKMAPYPNEDDFLTDDGYDDAAYTKAYDAWLADVRTQQQHSGYSKGIEAFAARSTQTFLSDDTEENRIYAPLNVYMALGMLAELTGQNSRRQILDLLGSTDIKALRKQAAGLWNANYRSDGIVTSILANSLWMNETINFNRPVMDILAAHYYASSYKGNMGTEQFDQIFKDWLNEQTGGLLKDQVSQEGLDAQTIMALASTIYFKARWKDVFYESDTYEEVFHTADGSRTCDFMHKYKSSQPFYTGSGFTAVSQDLNGSCTMWFLRPDDGVTPKDLLKDSRAIDFLTNKNRQSLADKKNAVVNLSIPKFDVSSSFALDEGLKALGVTDIFDADAADFSPMTTNLDTLCVTKTNHAARAAVNEEGVTAAAYTVINIDNTAALLPDDEVDFVLDRPFLFAVVNRDGLPLFTGVVYEP